MWKSTNSADWAYPIHRFILEHHRDPPSPNPIHEYLDDFVQFYILSTPDRMEIGCIYIYILYIYILYIYIISVYKYMHVHNMLFIELSTYVNICPMSSMHCSYEAMTIRQNTQRQGQHQAWQGHRWWQNSLYIYIYTHDLRVYIYTHMFNYWYMYIPKNDPTIPAATRKKCNTYYIYIYYIICVGTKCSWLLA